MATGASILAAGATRVLKTIFARAVPDYDGGRYAEGVAPDSEILRDADGTPTCLSSDEKSLFFLNGVSQGQDRLWQLHISRMAASGRLCEVAGKKALNVDVMLRQLDFSGRAKEDLLEIEKRAKTDKEIQAVLDMLQGFADGVNWAASNAKMLPMEFWLTGQRPWQEWKPVDSLLVLRLHAFAMSFGVQHSILRQALYEILGPEAAREWTRLNLSDEKNAPFTVPAHDSKISAELAKMDLKTALGPQREKGLGSNVFVVGGKLTESGSPIMASDPHLAVKVPEFWYQINLHFKPTKESKEKPFSGAGVAAVGVPGIFIGHNTFAAWGITLGYCDVEDSFVERLRQLPDGKDGMPQWEVQRGDKWEPVRVRKEVIKIKGSTPIVDYFIDTSLGCVLSYPSLQKYNKMAEVAVKASGGETKEGKSILSYGGLPLRRRARGAEGVYRLLRIRSFKEFDDALTCISRTASLNFSYADTDGHIGYVLAGEVPIRKGKRGEEQFILNGFDVGAGWDGWVPHANLPKSLDPDKNYVINANHKVVDYNEYRHYLGATFKAGFRAEAIEEELKKMIAKGHKMTLESCIKVQLCQLSTAAREFCALLAKTFEEIPQDCAHRKDVEFALKHLQGFDGVLSLDSTQATLYKLTHSFFVQHLLKTGLKTLESKKEVKDKLDENGLDIRLLETIVDGSGFDEAKALKLLNEFQGHLHINVLRMMRDPKDSWWVTTAGGLQKALSHALAEAVAKFGTYTDKTWGTVHGAAPAHAFTKTLGMAPGTGFDGPFIRLGGDTNTPNQCKCTSIDDLQHGGSNVSLRFLADMSDLRNGCRLITPVGICGVFGSPLYTNRLQKWANGEVPKLVWEETDVREAAAYKMKFNLKAPPSSLGAAPWIVVGIGVTIAALLRARK